MKMRYTVIIFTLCIFGIFFYNESYLGDNSYKMVDMSVVNDQCNLIKKDMDQGTDIKAVEEKYDCSIADMRDQDYAAVVNDAVSEGKILVDYEDHEGKIAGKIIFKGLSNNYNKLRIDLKARIRIILIATLIVGYLLICYLYIRLVKPFKNLQRFTSEVAKGNLDMPLKIQKGNYFGAFTESFDIMREELKSAREGEYRANISKKELVASLSHDIKTPVATIEAICEILAVKVKDQEILDKVQVINNKADVIDKLISNMFHAALEELKCLNVDKKEEPSTLVVDMIKNIDHFGRISFENEIPRCLVYADKLRLNQVIDNVINNSYKYAGTDIKVKFEDQAEGIFITISDEGPGVSEDELPLLTEKYFRGKNSEGRNGSGLGLFLSRLFMEGMNGEFQCYSENGFTVVLFLKKV